MKTTKLSYKLKNGKIIEKDVEERLVSIYKSNGWFEKKEVKKTDFKPEPKPTFVNRSED